MISRRSLFSTIASAIAALVVAPVKRAVGIEVGSKAWFDAIEVKDHPKSYNYTVGDAKGAGSSRWFVVAKDDPYLVIYTSGCNCMGRGRHNGAWMPYRRDENGDFYGHSGLKVRPPLIAVSMRADEIVGMMKATGDIPVTWDWQERYEEKRLFAPVEGTLSHWTHDPQAGDR